MEPALAVLGRMATPEGVGRRPAVDLQVEDVIAVPCRERWFPWRVLRAPLRLAATPLVRVPLVRTGGGWPWVARLFEADEELIVLPRHHGVCARCGGLAPCADELIESDLHRLVEPRSRRGVPAAVEAGVDGRPL